MTAENGAYVVNTMKEKGIAATVIGKITENHDRVVINQDEKRFLERPRSDEFSKIERNH